MLYVDNTIIRTSYEWRSFWPYSVCKWICLKVEEFLQHEWTLLLVTYVMESVVDPVQFLMYKWYHHQNVITFALINTLLLGSEEKLQFYLESLRRWATHFVFEVMERRTWRRLTFILVSEMMTWFCVCWMLYFPPEKFYLKKKTM